MRWLSLSLIAVVLAATIGLGWLFDVLYQKYSASFEPNSQDEIQYAEALTRQLAVTLSKHDAPQQFIQHWQDSNEYSLQVLPIHQLSLPQPLVESLKDSNLLNLESDSDLSIHFLMPDSDNVLILQIPFVTPSEPRIPDRYWITALFYLLLIVLFLLWAKPLVARLMQLRATARAFGKGDLSQRIAVGKVSYINDLETEFNHMAQRIEDLVSDVKLLSSAVSHDLRTPLARIRMGLDTLSEESDPIKRNMYEDRINEHIDDMVELIETLLSYARLDQAMLAVKKQPLDLKELIQTILLKRQFSDKSILFKTPSQSDSFLVHGDGTYLKMLANNLIQNAVQYCEKDIWIDLQKHGEHVLLCVSDDGPGIAPELGSDVFKPFVRSRTNKHKGHGVGLAICKRIADWHHGDIKLNRSEALKGAEFVVTLPVLK